MRESSQDKPQRVLIKLSGEALKGESSHGLCASVLSRLSKQVTELITTKKQVILVIGGGNFWRGLNDHTGSIDRIDGDYMGMLATIMNGIALKNIFNSQGIRTEILSAIAIPQICESFRHKIAEEALAQGKVLISVGGMGHPYFTTDTAAVLRAIELKCDVLLKATGVDGVFTEDPKKNSQATFLENVSYKDVITKKLAVMDLTAIVLAQDYKLPIKIFSFKKGHSFLEALEGTVVNTLISDAAH